MLIFLKEKLRLQDVHACECEITSYVINEFETAVNSSWMFV